MVEETDLRFVFDLDGTIATYGREVPIATAKVINQLPPVVIISGGTKKHLEWACSRLKHKVLIGMADYPGNYRIDCSAIVNVPKDRFGKTPIYQKMRRNLCMQLRAIHGNRVYVGGRSTIDLMVAINKAEALAQEGVHGKMVYFYDCEHLMNAGIHNDKPVVDIAYKAIKTSPYTIVKDVERWLMKAI
jgi:hypothetical protein